MSDDAAGLVAELRGRIADERVLAAVAAVPRERFVTAARRADAWADVALPIGGGQTISQPTVVARMCELLELRPGDRVLDVGTGSGYHAAVLGHLAAHVWGVERDARLAAGAREALAAAGAANVTVLHGDGALGHPDHAPYDAINVAARVDGDVPAALLAQLAPGGRLVAPVAGGRREERLVLMRRGPSGLVRSELEPVRFVPLR